MRQPILYAEELWRRQWGWALAFPVLGVLVVGLTLYQQHRVFDASLAISAAYFPIGIVWGGGLFLNRSRSRLEVTDAGLQVSKVIRSALIPYDLIRNVRVQKLEMHFQEDRKRLVRPMWRSLMTKPALFVRLKADDPRLPELRRRLGSFLTPGLLADDTLAVPIPDPDAMVWEIQGRLPERTGVNLGGRRKKRRGR